MTSIRVALPSVSRLPTSGGLQAPTPRRAAFQQNLRGEMPPPPPPPMILLPLRLGRLLCYPVLRRGHWAGVNAQRNGPCGSSGPFTGLGDEEAGGEKGPPVLTLARKPFTEIVSWERRVHQFSQRHVFLASTSHPFKPYCSAPAQLR